jgi:hypothetical protein
MSLLGRFTGRRLQMAANVIAVLFVVATAVLPLTHHSLECHRRSLAHCTACTVGSNAKAPHVHVAPADVQLIDAGAVVDPSSHTPDVPSLCQTSDRAPPAIG